MLTSEMIVQIRSQLHDISGEYDDDILIKYINTGIKSASYALAAANNSTMMSEITVSTGTLKPANFIKFAGISPVKITAGKFVIIDSNISSIVLRYYSARPNVSSGSDVLPFDEEGVLLYIEQYACVLALNRNEFDISNDTAILNNLKQEMIMSVEEG